MTIVDFFRHAHSPRIPDRQAERPLSERGRKAGRRHERRLSDRGVAAVERTLERYEGKSVVVGTHGSLLTLVPNRYDDRFDFEFWKGKLTTPYVYEARFADGELAAIARRYSG